MTKLIYIICAFGIIISILVWVIDSNDYGEVLIFSKDQKPVVKIVEDELFGTETKETEWIEGFWLGLLPPDDSISLKAFAGAVPISSVFIIISFITFLIKKKRIKK